jgi:hypothetical protein
MKEYYVSLQQLIGGMPVYNSRYDSKLSDTFSKYKAILRKVETFSEYYRNATNMHDKGFVNIEANIRRSHNARSEKMKDEAFKDARDGLQSDIEALMAVISSHEKFD